MRVSIFPSKINGIIKAPASKSCMQRACAAALLSNGKTVIKNPGFSNDDHVAISTIKKLGAQIEYFNEDLIVLSNGILNEVDEINCDESGLSVRMFCSIVALCKSSVTINGVGSLLKRPMSFFDDVFPKLNVIIKSHDGKLPLQICGPIIPQNIEVNGALSSQYLTGLLFAYSYLNAKDVSIKVLNLKSKPYIDLTLDILKKFEMKVPSNTNYETFYFSTSNVIPTKKIHYYEVEGDWSGASFLLVAGAISGTIKINGLSVASTQADKEILTALKLCGSKLEVENNEITISSSQLNYFNFDATECPDLFPPLVALAAYCNGISVIKGISRLTYKESNRALTLKEEFGKIGVRIELKNEEMLIYGGSNIYGGFVSSRNDHRIAMALSIVALKASRSIIIDDAEAINKSYPNFYEHLKLIGAEIEIID